MKVPGVCSDEGHGGYKKKLVEGRLASASWSFIPITVDTNEMVKKMRTSMKPRPASFIVPLILASLIGALAGPGLHLAEKADTVNEMKLVLHEDMIGSSDPAIAVYGNGGFASVPGITGNGSAINPYIIEDKVINASGMGSAISLMNTDAHVIIRNCTVTNAGWAAEDAGILLQNVTNANVSGNVALLNPRGIYAMQSKFTIIEKNNVSESDLYGIYVWMSFNVTISQNNASQNDQRGIYVASATNITISGNLATYNVYGIDASGSTRLAVIENDASHNNIGIELTNCNNNSISSNHASTNARGIQLLQSNWNHVEENHIIACSEEGLYVHEAGNNSILFNNITTNYIGIQLQQNSRDNVISNNDVKFNTFCGISLADSHNNNITANNVSKNLGNGLVISDSNDNRVISNVFRENENTWIYIGATSVGNTGSDNLCPLGQVEGLVVVPGMGIIVLNWTVPDGGWSRVSHYNIYRASAMYGSYSLVGTNDTVTGFADSGLANGQRCYYKVSAENALGEGENSTVVDATTWNVPGQVSDLVATAGDRRVTLSWSPPQGSEGEIDDGGTPITGYDVYWTLDNITYYKISLGIVTTYVHLDRANGQAYHYMVSAVNIVGAGANSTSASATPRETLPDTKPDAVPGYEPLFVLLALVLGLFAVTISWKRYRSPSRLRS